MIISMVFDSAYQALIKIEQRFRYREDSNATVKRALNFEGTDCEYWGSVIKINDGSFLNCLSRNFNESLDLDFQSDKDAYFSAVWYRDIINAISSETIVETSPLCSTKNCTFPIFSSLAFCSNCVDITQFLQQNSNCSQKERRNSKTGKDEDESSIMNCTYWLPSFSSGKNHSYSDKLDGNTSIELSWDVKIGAQPIFNEHQAPSLLTRFLQEFTISEPDRSSDGKNISSPFTAMALLKFAPRTGSASAGFLSSAHTCALSVCAKEYNMSMTSGVFRSQIVSTSYSEFDGPILIDQKHAGRPSYKFTFSDNLDNDFTVDSYLMNSISIPLNISDTTFDNSTIPIIVNDTTSDNPISGNPSSGESSSGDPSSGNSISGYVTSGDSISNDSTITIAFSVEDKTKQVLEKTLGGVLRLDYDSSSIVNWLTDPTEIYLIELNTSTDIPKTMDRIAAAPCQTVFAT